MSALLQEPISVLCDEVGISMPAADARGVYSIVIEGQEIRVSTLMNGKVILLGVIGQASTLAENRRESRRELLAGCLGLQAVRFTRLGTPEVLTLEPESGNSCSGSRLKGRTFPFPPSSAPLNLCSTNSNSGKTGWPPLDLTS